MTATENLHYAIGELAYAIAGIDGKVQHKERQKFHDIVAAELRYKDHDFEVSDIIFKILDKDKLPAKDAYNDAIRQIRLHSHYLSPELKAACLKIIEKIAKAYPPLGAEEIAMINQLKKDIEPIHGDPVYYKA